MTHGLYGIGIIIDRKFVEPFPIWQSAGLTVWYQYNSVISTTLPVTVEWWDISPMAGCYTLSVAIGRMAKDAEALAEE